MFDPTSSPLQVCLSQLHTINSYWYHSMGILVSVLLYLSLLPSAESYTNSRTDAFEHQRATGAVQQHVGALAAVTKQPTAVVPSLIIRVNPYQV